MTDASSCRRRRTGRRGARRMLRDPIPAKKIYRPTFDAPLTEMDFSRAKFFFQNINLEKYEDKWIFILNFKKSPTHFPLKKPPSIIHVDGWL